MKATIKIDSSRFNAALAKFARYSKKDGQELIFDQAKLLVQKVIEITPPATGKANAAARKRGEAAISADLARIFSPATPEFVNRFIAFNGGRVLQEDFRHRGAAALGFVYTRALERSEMEEWHKARRTSSGRVRSIDRDTAVGAAEKKAGAVNRRRAASITTGLRTGDLRALDIGLVTKADYKWFENRQKGRVGLLAGGWNRAALTLGAKVPDWIRRQGTARGTVTIELGESRMRIFIANDVEYADHVKDFERRVQQATDLQARAMERRVEHYLAQLGAKSGF